MSLSEMQKWELSCSYLIKATYLILTDHLDDGIPEDVFHSKLQEFADVANINSEWVAEFMKNTFETKVLIRKDGRYYPGDSFFPPPKNVH